MRDIAHEQIAAGGSAVGHWGMRVLRLARTVLFYAGRRYLRLVLVVSLDGR